MIFNTNTYIDACNDIEKKCKGESIPFVEKSLGVT